MSSNCRISEQIRQFKIRSDHRNMRSRNSTKVIRQQDVINQIPSTSPSEASLTNNSFTEQLTPLTQKNTLIIPTQEGEFVASNQDWWSKTQHIMTKIISRNFVGWVPPPRTRTRLKFLMRPFNLFGLHRTHSHIHRIAQKLPFHMHLKSS